MQYMQLYDQWADTGMCSEFEVEKVNFNTNAKFPIRHAQKQDDENGLVWSEGICRPILETDDSIEEKCEDN